MRPHAAAQAVASDHTSLQRWAPESPCVPRPWTSPPCRGGFRHCHVSHGSGLCLLERRASALSCSSAPDLASLSRWAPALPRGPDLASSRGELWCCHVPHNPQQAVDHRNKERSNCPRHATRLACVQSTVMCYRDACKAFGQVATVRFNSATHAQLTTPGHDYNADHVQHSGVRRHDDSTLLTPCKTSLATPSH
jgi:hypothetical protein